MSQRIRIWIDVTVPSLDEGDGAASSVERMLSPLRDSDRPIPEIKSVEDYGWKALP